jgi:3-methyl-2-oxobutanoate hydroxymethyltransferase
MEKNALTIKDILAKKNIEKIVALTSYDFVTASILDEAGIDIILVGDSLGNVVLGYENTVPVTMNDMLRHTKAVSRAVKKSLVVADMPFLSYQVNEEEAIKNAAKFIQEASAKCIKLEGGRIYSGLIKRITNIGIPVMGHIGLLPQSVHQSGGYFIKGKTEIDAKNLIDDALSLEDAGAFSIVLECVKEDVAQEITKKLKIPTIGIGSGNSVDGQILVINDLLGYSVRPIPKFAHPVLDLRNIVNEAILKYIERVKK